MISISKSRFGADRRVVMLVNNPCVNDSRVIKSAKALASDGWMVTVVCRHEKNLPLVEEKDGVVYHRLSPLPRDTRSILRLFKCILIAKVGSYFNAIAKLVSLKRPFA